MGRRVKTLLGALSQPLSSLPTSLHHKYADAVAWSSPGTPPKGPFPVRIVFKRELREITSGDLEADHLDNYFLRQISDFFSHYPCLCGCFQIL